MRLKFRLSKAHYGLGRTLILVVVMIMLINACGGDDDAEQPALADPTSAEGQEVFDKNCARCHSFEEGKVIVGPSLNGIAASAGTRMDGLDAGEYLHTSITKPSAYLVDGYNDLMQSNFGQLLSGEDIEAVIAYLLTFE
jgi:cytochrome c2